MAKRKPQRQRALARWIYNLIPSKPDPDIMKVFLSWSGDQSRAAACAVREWLPFVINAVHPWMSAADIGAGKRWSSEIQSQLKETRFGILFVTKSNANAPWLIFEAGALAKTLQDTFVCPYCLGLKPAELPNGPLTLFQAKVANEEETWQLVQTINLALKGEAIAEGRLRTAFDKWWPDLQDKLDALPIDPVPVASSRTPDDMTEEILTIVRSLDRSASRSRSLEQFKQELLDDLERLKAIATDAPLFSALDYRSRQDSSEQAPERPDA